MTTKSGPSIIQLSNRMPFASGTKRDCYIHPNDPDLIIKVIPAHKSIEVLHSSKIWIRRMLQTPESMDANRGEREKFEKLGKKFENLRESIPNLVEYRGQVQTDLGEGLLFRAIKNYDGAISESLGSAAKTGGYVRASLLGALQSLESVQGDGSIYNDLGIDNLVVEILDSSHSKYKLWIIDGINCRSLIPVAEYVEMYARVRKAKKLRKIKEYILYNFPSD